MESASASTRVFLNTSCASLADVRGQPPPHGRVGGVDHPSLAGFGIAQGDEAGRRHLAFARVGEAEGHHVVAAAQDAQGTLVAGGLEVGEDGHDPAPAQHARARSAGRPRGRSPGREARGPGGRARSAARGRARARAARSPRCGPRTAPPPRGRGWPPRRRRGRPRARRRSRASGGTASRRPASRRRRRAGAG